MESFLKHLTSGITGPADKHLEIILCCFINTAIKNKTESDEIRSRFFC